MGDDQEARLRGLGDLLDQAAEAVDIGVVQRRVDLVQHADRRRVGEEDGEDQRQSGQRLLAAREQRQGLQLLARRAGIDLEPGFERIAAARAFAITRSARAIELDRRGRRRRGG